MLEMTIEELRKIVEEMAAKIQAPARLLPTYDFPIGDATPFIDQDSGGHFHYVISERGHEFERTIPLDLDGLLYRIFSDITSDMATYYESRHRIETEDSRRQLFQKQVELMRTLNAAWGDRKAEDHAQILKTHPFDDGIGQRVSYYVKLKQESTPEDEAWQRALAKHSSYNKKF